MSRFKKEKANAGTVVGIAPPIAPVVLGLNNSAAFLGATAAGLIGAAGIDTLGGHELGYVAAALVAAALIVSELAARKIAASNRNPMVPPGGSAEQGKARGKIAMKFDFESLNEVMRYKLMLATVLPRPIIWVTSQDNNGLINAAPLRDIR
jgi:hypothetical protein